ncbi:MAG: protein translocase subunit SecD [bacterium]
MPNIIEKIFQPSQRGRVWRSFVFIIILVVAGLLIDVGEKYNTAADYISDRINFTLPHTKEIPFRLGLDLLGGSHMVYQADMANIDSADRSSALEGVRDVIERRVNAYGVSEPIVQTSTSGGDYRIVVELAGIKDVNEAIRMIGETPLLEFKEQAENERELTAEEAEQMEEYNNEKKKKAEEVLGKLLSGGDFASLARDYGDDEKTKEIGGDLGWITAQDSFQMTTSVKNLKVGDITDIEERTNGYQILKLTDKRKKTNPFDETKVEKEVKASHILVCYQDAEGCQDAISKEEAYAKIKEIKNQATPKNFASLAEKYSTDMGSASNGGELGWFAQEMMVEPFSDTVFDNQTKGTISYVVETKFGYHIIYKEDERDIDEYRLSHMFFATISESDILGDQREWKLTELTGKNLEGSEVQFNPNDSSPEVVLKFDKEGADLFENITERNVGKVVGIFLDGNAISMPTVNEKISGGEAVISGKFNVNEAKELKKYLNAGALPVPIYLLSQQTVGASLGKASLLASLRAGAIGIMFVALFMVLLYRLPGIVSVFSLTIYGVLVLAIFKIWPVTLTLSGVAGFILSIGMAVDANVLIFERLKEELKDGMPLNEALENSFSRAWPSIRDGNISTLLTCVILYMFSTSIVKGFAVTLFLGVSISMFSAIIITKILLKVVIGKWLEKRMWLFSIKK